MVKNFLLIGIACLSYISTRAQNTLPEGNTEKKGPKKSLADGNKTRKDALANGTDHFWKRATGKNCIPMPNAYKGKNKNLDLQLDSFYNKANRPIDLLDREYAQQSDSAYQLWNRPTDLLDREYAQQNKTAKTDSIGKFFIKPQAAR